MFKKYYFSVVLIIFKNANENSFLSQINQGKKIQ